MTLYCRICLLLLLLLSLAACSKSRDSELPVRPIYSVIVPDPTGSTQRRFTGSLQAAQSSTMSFEVSGRIMELRAKEGQTYKQGQLIARLDCTSYENDLLDAKSTFQRSVQELQRKQALFESGNASKQDLDNALAERTSSKARLENAQKNVNDCTLEMPYDGMINTVEVDEQQTISVGSPVVKIIGESGMELEIGVPEMSIEQFAVGMEGVAKLDSLPKKDFPITVTEISQTLSDSGTYLVTTRLDVVNDGMRSGMAGKAFFTFTSQGTLSSKVPFESVAGAPDGRNFVWVFEPSQDKIKGKVKRRYVTVGDLIPGGKIEVLQGVKSGERIVTRGVHLLEEGMMVKLLDEQSPSGEA